ncbi:MAG: hypothetical protein OEV49_17555 [candidate division Zixibacteria bacterium]|nr:hypothetical protein [candidate division Zixibacteria bacterium]MDH3938425.1 hypothetical protein [candidate division Zixibacteria bacterium]MDH4034718.1 hypothetical protein [candidate division Zixibacteria bacterium]
MYTIKKTSYGFQFSFMGHFPKDEAKLWARDASQAFLTYEGNPGVFVDMRDMELMPPESRQYVIDVQRIARKNGMIRSAVILKDKITTMQLMGIAKETGIYEWERYIDANAEPNWEKVGLDWVIHGIDPDEKSHDVQSVSHDSA